MALTRAEKEAVVEEITSILNTSKSVVFLNFHGVNVQETTDMRSDLADNQVGYLVAKKSLIKLAIENSDLEKPEAIPELAGEIALSYTDDDETAAAREIYKFQEQYDDRVSIQAGVFEGELLGQEDMLEIARIPGMDQLRGMFANLMNSPMQRLAIAMQAIADNKPA